MLELARRLFQTKQSATTRLDVQNTTGSQAVWTSRDYKTLAREGYEQAVYVYACIRALTTQTSYVRPILYQERRGGEMVELETHPLLDLISRPNDEQAIERFIETAYATFLLSGNAYVERVGLENRPPVELYVKRPDRMRVLSGNAQQRVAGYEYAIGGDKHRFDYWQVLHLKTFSPLDDFYGLSPLAAASRGVDVFNAGQAHNLALLQNGARPSGAWVNSSTMTDDQFRRLREQIDDATRTQNRGRPILLEGGISWQELGVNPRDLDFLAGQEDAARQIHAAYGVHPVLTGLQSGTFENQRESIRNLVTLSVFPFLDTFFGELTRWIAPAYGDGLRLSFDRNAFPAFSDDESELLERARGAYKDGLLTLNEARAMAGYGYAVDGDDFVSARVPQFTLSTGHRNSEEPQITAKPPRKPDEYMVWKARDTQRQLYEERMNRVTERVFKAQRKAIAEAVDNQTAATIGVAVDNVITVEQFQPLRELYLATMLDAGQMTLDQIGFTRTRNTLQPDNFSLFREVFGLFFDQTITFAQVYSAELVQQVNETTKRQLRSIITPALERGDSVATIAAEIDSLFLDQIIPNRSYVIARTEAVRAANRGSVDAARGTGLELEKVWVATFDSGPYSRQEHQDVNGFAVPLDSTFTVWNEQLDHPGDPKGRADNTIQCRCVLTYRRRTNATTNT